MRTSNLGACVLALGALLPACGGRSIAEEPLSSVPACVPGGQALCGCVGGDYGAQVCLDDGTYGPCDCDGSGPGQGGAGAGVGAGAGSGASGQGGSGAGAADPVGEETEIGTGTSVLVDVMVQDAGIVIITRDAVALVDRAGATLQKVDWPRDITAAAFDGSSLVIADEALFTTLDLDLQEVAGAELVEECASAVMISGDRFVCGPPNDWDRIFYTYATTTGELLAASDEYTYNGIPMRRIPGTDELVTVTVDSSPSDYHLYTVLSDTVTYVGESPYHGDFPINGVYAFDGVPPAHLVTHEGLMLTIHAPGCEPGDWYNQSCFVKDGALGTLSDQEKFVGMDNDADGKVYGITASGSWDGLCEPTCGVQRVNVASHTVEAEAEYTLDIGEVIAARHDPISKTLVVGYRLEGDYYFEDDPYPGYRVVLLPYE